MLVCFVLEIVALNNITLDRSEKRLDSLLS